MELKKTKTKTRETFTCIWSNIGQYEIRTIGQYEIRTMREREREREREAIVAFVSVKFFIFYLFTLLVFDMAKNINKLQQARPCKKCSNRKLSRVTPLTQQKIL